MLNKVIIEGRLTADPELRQTPNGVSVCRFSVAWNGQGDKVDFFDVTAWRNTAEFVCRNFKKGNGITIDGHLETHKYEAKIPQTNKTYMRTAWEIVADNVHFPVYSGAKEEKKEEYTPTPYTQTHATFEEVESDEKLPF
jgi:single-strand DNA-binding protein